MYLSVAQWEKNYICLADIIALILSFLHNWLVSLMQTLKSCTTSKYFFATRPTVKQTAWESFLNHTSSFCLAGKKLAVIANWELCSFLFNKCTAAFRYKKPDFHQKYQLFQKAVEKQQDFTRGERCPIHSTAGECDTCTEQCEVRHKRHSCHGTQGQTQQVKAAKSCACWALELQHRRCLCHVPLGCPTALPFRPQGLPDCVQAGEQEWLLLFPALTSPAQYIWDMWNNLEKQ